MDGLTVAESTTKNDSMNLQLPERPRIRPGLAAAVDDRDPRFVVVWDELRISSQYLRLPRGQFEIVSQMNGARTWRDLRAANGDALAADSFAELLEQLDAVLFLDSPRFADYLDSPVREPSCIGCYSADPDKLRQQLHSYFVADGGPGLPARPATNDLRAVLVPHIDYARGGQSYAWGFKEVVERSTAEIFVVIGTSHYSQERFSITRKNFKTPLGVMPTDQPFIDRLERHYGAGLYDDPVAHYPEHSIELEVVFLQYLFENIRPIRIVPLVVGSFRDCVRAEVPPAAQPDIRRMVAALQQAEAETPESICYIISGDLAHIGPKFGDSGDLSEPALEHSRQQDHKLLHCAQALDLAGYFAVIAGEDDERRICGLPPTLTVLAAAQPSSGRLLHYSQYVHPERFESVSFASMVFHR